MIKKLFKTGFSTLFYINALFLLLSLSASYIDPIIFWPPAVFGLFFKFFIVVHVMFGLLFLFTGMLRMLIPTIIIVLICYESIADSFVFGQEEIAVVETEKPLEIMTWNVKAFAWFSRPRLIDSVKRMIVAEDPDILCMQEYYHHDFYGKELFEWFTSKNHYPYHCFYKLYKGQFYGYDQYTGIMLMSKYPLSELTPIPFENTGSNGSFYCDITVGEKRIRLINSHLQSYQLSETEYTLPGGEVDSTELSQLKSGLTKLRNAFRKRSYQAMKIKGVIENSPHKVILCGDFNDSPVSFVHTQFEEELKDAYNEGGFGIGTTFAGKIPFLRIDYIFVPNDAIVQDTYVVKQKLSDHYPLVTRVFLP